MRNVIGMLCLFVVVAMLSFVMINCNTGEPAVDTVADAAKTDSKAGDTTKPTPDAAKPDAKAVDAKAVDAKPVVDSAKTDTKTGG